MAGCWAPRLVTGQASVARQSSHWATSGRWATGTFVERKRM